MPYSFSGVELDSNDWVVEFDSNVWASLSREISDLTVPGRDGSVSVRGGLEAPALSLVVYTPVDALAALLSLFSPGWGVLSDGLREVAVDVAAITPTRLSADHARVSVVLSVPGVFWRSTTETTTTPVAISSASVAVSVFPGISAPIRDAIIRVKGSVTGLTVLDSRGSSFTYTAVLLGSEWLRFEAATGRAFVTTSDVWTGGTEVTSLVTNGPGPYYLELTPTFSDPVSRVAVLTVGSSARSGSPVVEVRGKNAFLV